MSYKQITTTLMSLEEKFNLFSLKQDGVYVWKLIRMPVMTYLISKANNINSIHGTVGKKEKLLSAVQFFLNSVISNPFFINRDISKIIIENPRKIYWNDRIIDPYTHFFLNESQDYHVLENIYKLKHMKSVFKPSSSTHFLLISAYLKKKLSKKKSFSIQNLDILKLVKQQIQRELDIEVPIINIALEKYCEFITNYSIYNSLFKMKKWKEIYIVCSYGKESIISAAQENNVKVIEFQHGVMGPYHLGYHFPSLTKVPYFPDEIYLFGDYWDKTTSLPNNTKKNYYGYPYLKEYIYQRRNEIGNKQRNEIVIVSQGNVGKELSEFVYNLAVRLTNYSFKYKLHPGEFGRWKKEYPQLLQMSKLSNVEIIEDEKNLYDLFTTSSIVIGVSSTAIFEAVAFKVQPIIVKLSSYEYMLDLNRQFNVPILESSIDVEKYILDYEQEDMQININSLFKDLKIIN
ncbi:hypothetical protein [Virgibacillus halodenitrificans]|uniref:hypothetical protein n=1 Tax=Virgibacillus halodenitrificans TaxID=1482 RepID=UPI002DBCE1BF|nr:hypothetical protein [Virgibacillus halodenitrificans]MEC2159780.1 hypothetical protein [Virgibacillus halodenitrificans]